MMLKKIGSYVLLNVWLLVAWLGALSIGALFPDGWGILVRFLGGFAVGFGGAQLNRRLASYWRDRQIEKWVNEAYPTDSARDQEMRHDLIHGNDEYKPRRRPAWPEEAEDKAMLRRLTATIKEGRSADR